MKMTYALLGVGAGKEAALTETREIRYEGEMYGKPQVNVSRGDGTYVTSIPITLPNDAKKGNTVLSRQCKALMRAIQKR